jgi:hypothetical protein
MKLVNRSVLVLKPTSKYLTWQGIRSFFKHMI